jgi:polyamine oxidase
VDLPEATPLQRQDNQCRHTQVLVLGGGIAGVTAAQTLANQSITDFLIVEYLGDLGGRVAHTTFGASPDGTPYVVELGANWVQGLQTDDGPVNPIWTLAQKYKVTNTYSNYSKIETFNETGAVDYSNLLDELDEAYTQYEIDAGYIITDNLQDMSVRSALTLAGWKPRKDPARQAAEWWYFDWEVSI